LDKIPYYDENNNRINHYKNERIEQYVATEYVLPSYTVLELGGRYGTAACVINNKLENPHNHVVIEPDKTVIKALLGNAKSHKSKFTVINTIISNKSKKLVQLGYATTIEDTTKHDKNKLKTISLKEIMKITDLKFDCLIADCEGCLCEFIEENSKYIKKYKMISFEADWPNKCNYSKIHKKLTKWKFKQIMKGFVSVWIK